MTFLSRLFSLATTRVPREKTLLSVRPRKSFWAESRLPVKGSGNGPV
jgi:hypothetical protein